MGVSMRRAIAFTVLFLGLASFAPAGAVAADGEVSALGGAPLEVSAEQGKDAASTHLSLFNSTAKPVNVSFTLQGASEETVSLEAKPATLATGKATRAELTFSGLGGLDEKFEGQVVVSGSASPLPVEVKISPAPQPAADWPLLIVLVSLGVALLVAFVLLLATNAWSSLGSPAPGPKWSFESWATTLTAAGGVLGTVLGETTFPEFPQEISKATLVNLNVLFVALLVVGPFVFQALRRPRSNAADQEAGLWGWNATLLLACTITFWAVLGELGTLGFLSWELCDGSAVAWFLIAGLAIAAILAVVYFCVTVSQLVKNDWSGAVAAAVAVAAVAPAAPTAAAVGAAPTPVAPPTPHRWSLL